MPRSQGARQEGTGNDFGLFQPCSWCAAGATVQRVGSSTGGALAQLFGRHRCFDTRGLVIIGSDPRRNRQLAGRLFYRISLCALFVATTVKKVIGLYSLFKP